MMAYWGMTYGLTPGEGSEYEGVISGVIEVLRLIGLDPQRVSCVLGFFQYDDSGITPNARMQMQIFPLRLRPLPEDDCSFMSDDERGMIYSAINTPRQYEDLHILSHLLALVDKPGNPHSMLIPKEGIVTYNHKELTVADQIFSWEELIDALSMCKSLKPTALEISGVLQGLIKLNDLDQLLWRSGTRKLTVIPIPVFASPTAILYFEEEQINAVFPSETQKRDMFRLIRRLVGTVLASFLHNAISFGSLGSALVPKKIRTGSSMTFSNIEDDDGLVRQFVEGVSKYLLPVSYEIEGEACTECFAWYGKSKFLNRNMLEETYTREIIIEVLNRKIVFRMADYWALDDDYEWWTECFVRDRNLRITLEAQFQLLYSWWMLTPRPFELFCAKGRWYFSFDAGKNHSQSRLLLTQSAGCPVLREILMDKKGTERRWEDLAAFADVLRKHDGKNVTERSRAESISLEDALDAGLHVMDPKDTRGATFDELADRFYENFDLVLKSIAKKSGEKIGEIESTVSPLLLRSIDAGKFVADNILASLIESDLEQCIKGTAIANRTWEFIEDRYAVEGKQFLLSVSKRHDALISIEKWILNAGQNESRELYGKFRDSWRKAQKRPPSYTAESHLKTILRSTLSEIGSRVPSASQHFAESGVEAKGKSFRYQPDARPAWYLEAPQRL